MLAFIFKNWNLSIKYDSEKLSLIQNGRTSGVTISNRRIPGSTGQVRALWTYCSVTPRPCYLHGHKQGDHSYRDEGKMQIYVKIQENGPNKGNEQLCIHAKHGRRVSFQHCGYSDRLLQVWDLRFAQRRGRATFHRRIQLLVMRPERRHLRRIFPEAVSGMETRGLFRFRAHDVTEGD